MLGISAVVLLGCSAHSPAPVSSIHKDYDTIERGSYRGSYYEVQKGDTLYFIAYVTDKNVNDLIRYNNLSAPYTIHPGQKLKIWQPLYQTPAYGGSGTGNVSTSAKAVTAVGTVTSGGAVVSTTAPSLPTSPSKNTSNSTTKSTSKNSNLPESSNKKRVDQSKSKEYVDPKGKQNVNEVVSKPSSKDSKITKWLWPTKGRVVQKFSSGDQGNKGIDIAGQRGQSVVSTANGTVVYSGDALRGYGNLIIVKHNDNYLSAYAHNDRLLVSEGQNVKAGQKIATMGSSGSNSVKLHFEIRYQGKSVNPQRYLP